MDSFASTLLRSRRASGLTQAQVSATTGIARPNIAAYEAGRREPRLSTALNLLQAVGATLDIASPPNWHWTPTQRPYAVASHLWRLPTQDALRRFQAPPHLWWSGPPRTFDLSNRTDRLRAYEVVLREGTPRDIAGVVDGTLLCEAWPDLVLPADLRRAWQTAIDNTAALSIDETAS